ncbi:protein FAR1-RELATED SEQUENCE 5-like [Rosa rugosa]|uniref:protein FAR1-RELATED SEQUENCE 5-like n=1 Tax=Rosa rugosa TaxID=74645 RepID=UPI002B4165F7|nr:protein FAR1-RELATED SEQUENCE 5-like [Rosa rugosa]
MTEIFHKENLQIAKVHSILGGAQIGFNKRDCYNHLRNVHHRQLDGGDAQSVLTYFRKKQAENPQFFYAIQCDEDGRATNFFWVDSRSRTAYEYFGDVVTFDTTYRTNKYDMSFAPFTGVNHHWQSIQFGCALLQDETEATFLWLFETWLQAMGGRHPISIITDQDLAMKGAIAKIFPNTRHRLCLWHIKKKFVEKLSHESSEGINSFFDGFVTSTTNLREFVVKYDQALKRIIDNESDEDFETEHKFRIVNDDEFLLKDAAKLYTRNVFNKFKVQWIQIKHYKVEERECDNEWHSYLVKKRLGEHEQDFMVKIDLTTYKGSCECQNFEFVGILCRHLLKVFSRLDIETIPAHFILPRWRQEANKFRIMDSEDLVKSVGKEESEAVRLSHMYHQATKLACIAAPSKEGYTILMDALNEVSRKLPKISDQPAIIREMSVPLNQDDHTTMETSASPNRDDPCTNILSSQSLLLDTNISKTKGKKKETKSSGRIKSGVELAMETGKRSVTCLSHYFGFVFILRLNIAIAKFYML